MTDNNSKFQKRDFLYGGCITAIIAGIAFFLWIIGFTTDIFDPIGKALDNYHLSDGFFYAESKRHRAVTDINPGIVIVDIGDCDSRKEISELVNTINSANPKLLAVDIIFGKSPTISSEEDSLLKDAFSRVPHLVLASRCVEGANGWQTERSFFSEELNCTEGDVNYENGIVRTFSSIQSFGNITVPSFVGQVARLGGLCDSFPTQLINYSPDSTITLLPDKLTHLELLNNQIVLLGDRHDLRDYHDIPVLMDGMPRTSGLNISAQCLYSLQSGKTFRRCPQWLDILIGVLLTYLFCTFIASPKYRIKQFNGFWISLCQIGTLIILVALTYLVFWKFHYSISLKYWLIGVGFSGFATEFFYFFFIYKQYRETKLYKLIKRHRS